MRYRPITVYEMCTHLEDRINGRDSWGEERHALGVHSKHEGREKEGHNAKEEGDLLAGTDDLGRLPRDSKLGHARRYLRY